MFLIETRVTICFQKLPVFFENREGFHFRSLPQIYKEDTQWTYTLLSAGLKQSKGGVDIGAAILIRHALIALRDQGAAILVVSEDIDELYSISDRICAICDGELSPVDEINNVSINQLGKWMAGDFSPITHQAVGV